MAQPNKPTGKSANTKVRDKKPATYASLKKEPETLFSGIDKFFNKNSKFLVIFILGLGVLFSLLLFQARMDTGGDDSGYITRAYDFIHKGVFPSYQGPLYPLVLSIFVSVLGIKIVFLKFLSIIFNFIALLFLYKAFKGRIPSFVLYSVLLLAAVNTYILNFASETYNESFFMALQYIFFYYFFKLQDSLKPVGQGQTTDTWRVWLPVGVLLLLMTLTRNIAISWTMACITGLMIYFGYRKQFKHLIYLGVGALVAIIYEKTQGSSQGDLLTLIDPYNASKGKRHIGDFISDFFQNSNLYISKRLYQILGFKSDIDMDTSPWLTFFTIIILLFAIYRIIKSKNRYLLIASLYVLVMAGATFFALQTRWDQPRMVMIYVPLLLMIFLYGLYDLFKKSPFVLQMMVFLIVPILFIYEFKSTIQKANENLPIIKKKYEW